MATQKPDLTRVWANTAPPANVVDPDVTTPGKVTAGWQAEVPPFEHFNFLQKWFTQGLAHFNEQGIGVWDTDTTYPVNGMAKGSDGNIYKALVEQNGNDPVSDTSGTNWILIDFSLFVTSSQFSTADEAAEFAYANNKILVLLSGESAKLVCDPTGGDDIQDMAGWLRQCVVSGDAELYLELADGIHTVSTFIDIDGPGNVVDIRGTSTPDLLDITDISFSAVSGTLYECTVTISTALPAQAVVGYPIGMQQVKGDNDAALASGGQIIKSIAGDRLSFTFDFDSPRAIAPVDPTALDNTLEYSLVANELLVPKGALIAQSTGWDGSAREGFINCLNGGRLTLRNMGIAYSGATDEHDLLFARDTGSRIYLFDRTVLAGAGDKVLRQFGASEMYINRSCVGGAGIAQEIWQGTAGSTAQFVRSSCGGSTVAGMTAGSGSFCSFAQAQLVASVNMLRAVGAGSEIAFQTARIVGGTRGLYAQPGIIYTTSAEIERCTTGIDWLAGGHIIGSVTFGAGSQANTTDSQEPGNIEAFGGGWFEDITKNLYDPGVRISLPNNGSLEAPLSGVGGVIKATCETLPQVGFEIDVDLVSPGTIFLARYQGSELVLGSGDISPPLNSGKVTISVFDDAGTYKLKILNEDGGTRAFSLYAFGNIAFGDFS